jgi:hypothetical protein
MTGKARGTVQQMNDADRFCLSVKEHLKSNRNFDFGFLIESL